MRVLTHVTPEYIDQSILVAGWVHRVRKHGSVTFIDLRDRTGILQVVSGKWSPEVYEHMNDLSPEDVVEIQGTVVARGEKAVNPELVTGTVEMQAESVRVLSSALTPPFAVNESTQGVDEELRLEYRYLDLRTARMQANLRARAAATTFLRNSLDAEGFIEVETPLLTATTPEGARDFLVPTRRKGSFFALPQSPQQFKQLLMVGGVERYYQIARCMRDEDSRGDRQPEFTQLDMELSFATQEDVLQLNEKLVVNLVQNLWPEKRIQQQPFPRMTYAQAMEQYGTDRPDLRTDTTDSNLLAFCWVTDFPFFEKTDEGGWTFTHNPFSMPHPDQVQAFLRGEVEGVLAQQYDLALNGYEIAGGSVRSHLPELTERVFSTIGYTKETIQQQFGHMLRAFTYGAPPHAGIAWGFDRLIMILQGEPNIREVIAFAKTGEGRDPLMHAPGPVPDVQLRDLGLQSR